MNHKLIMAVGLTALSANTYAVRYGQDVDAAEYRDYTVRFEVPDSSGIVASCGGTLLAQEYILTAAHCVGNYDAAYTANYEWFIDAGAANTITVFQGIKWDTDISVSTTYTVIPLTTDSGSITDAYKLASKERDAVIAMNPNSAFSPTTSESLFEAALHRDVVLVKLTDKVSQSTSATITPMYSESADTFELPFNSTLTFRGWGQTESGRPEVMQSTSMHYDQIGTGRSMGNAFQLDNGFKACNNELVNCYYDLSDMVRFSPVSGTEATGASGDSGTPLVDNNDRVIGVAKDIPNDYSYTRFTTLTYYLADIAKNVAKISAPSNVSYEEEIGAKAKYTHAVEIQNLSSSSETLNPYLTGDTAWFSISGCDTSLTSYESCTLTVTTNPLEESFTEDLAAAIHLGDSHDQSISITMKITQTDNGGSDNGDNGGSDNGDNGGSDNGDNSGSSGGSNSGGGGGSMSWLGLAILVLARKLRKV